jgi:hypothetical protein
VTQSHYFLAHDSLLSYKALDQLFALLLACERADISTSFLASSMSDGECRPTLGRVACLCEGKTDECKRDLI